MTIVTPPENASSAVTLDSAIWNGGTATEIVNTAIPSLLAVGDSFVFQFMVEIDPEQTMGVLENTVTAGADAVDVNGDLLIDSSGNPIMATDDSDNGADPNGDNGEGGSDDPTPLILPPIASPETITAVPGEPVILDLLGNDVALNGGSISLLGEPELLDPSSGTLEFINGDWVFTSAPGFFGEAVILYVLQDENGNTASSTHTVIVEGEPEVGELLPGPVHVASPL